MSNNTRSTSTRWPQGGTHGRWPPPIDVAFARLEQQEEGYTPDPGFAARKSTLRDPTPPGGIPSTTKKAPPAVGVPDEVHTYRADALLYLERKRANMPNVGKSVKIKVQKGYEGLKENLVEGQVGYFLGKCATEHDLANVPRIPDSAIVGITEDSFHSRDSYAEICNDAIDYARRNLVKGKRGKLGYYIVDSEEEKDPKERHTVIPESHYTVQEGPDAYMHLFDEPVISRVEQSERQRKNQSAPSVLAIHQDRQKQKADKAYKQIIEERKAETLQQHPTILRSGPDRQGKKEVSFQILDSAPGNEHEEPIDPRVPIDQPYKAETYHGIEAERAVSPKRPRSVYVHDLRKPQPNRFNGPAAIQEQQACMNDIFTRELGTHCGAATRPKPPPIEIPVRPTLVKSDSGTNLSHINSVVFSGPKESPGTPQTELYRNASFRTRSSLKTKKKNRTTTVQPMYDTDALIRLKNMSDDTVAAGVDTEHLYRAPTTSSKHKFKGNPLNPEARTFEGPNESSQPSEPQVRVSEGIDRTLQFSRGRLGAGNVNDSTHISSNASTHDFKHNIGVEHFMKRHETQRKQRVVEQPKPSEDQLHYIREIQAKFHKEQHKKAKLNAQASTFHPADEVLMASSVKQPKLQSVRYRPRQPEARAPSTASILDQPRKEATAPAVTDSRVRGHIGARMEAQQDFTEQRQAQKIQRLVRDERLIPSASSQNSTQVRDTALSARQTQVHQSLYQHEGLRLPPVRSSPPTNMPGLPRGMF